MSFKIPPEIKKLSSSFKSFGSANGSAQKTVLRALASTGRTLLRQEFASGIDPSGTPWQDTVRGKQALQSRKLAGAFVANVVPGGVKFIGSVTRGWLEAVQEGHQFAARQVADKANVMRFNSRGRLIGKAKFGKLLDKRLSSKKPSKRRYKVRFAKAHTVKARTLPPRPMVPSATGELPARWEKPISDAVARGIEWWAEKATK